MTNSVVAPKSRGNEQAALRYTELGWPVLPGATWDGTWFIDPASSEPTDDVSLRPLTDATTDGDVVREWWGPDGQCDCGVLTVTGPDLGVVAVHVNVAIAVIGQDRFKANPTPVFWIENTPVAFFLVKPSAEVAPDPSQVATFDNARVVPLPPTRFNGERMEWIVVPSADTPLLAAETFYELIKSVTGTSATPSPT